MSSPSWASSLKDSVDFTEGNPFLLMTVKEFLDAQEKAIKEQNKALPPTTEFECKKCGDCCRWNAFDINFEEPILIDEIYRYGGKYPHGYWVAMDNRIYCYLPFWDGRKMRMWHFHGPLLRKQVDFLVTTGRRHGYWIMRGRIATIYSPTPCQHLQQDNLCAIYKERPKVCRDYMCRRHPVLT